jgi:predicted nucleic acid-binding protein
MPRSKSSECVLYADTSFLVSLLLDDANSTAARSTLATLDSPLGISPLGRLEFRNAVWQRVGRKGLKEGEASKLFRRFEARFSKGYFLDLPVHTADVWEKANAISDRYTAALGLRSLDIWHIAFAIVCGAESVCTFDTRMSEVAKAEGLEVIP